MECPTLIAAAVVLLLTHCIPSSLAHSWRGAATTTTTAGVHGVRPGPAFPLQLGKLLVAGVLLGCVKDAARLVAFLAHAPEVCAADVANNSSVHGALGQGGGSAVDVVECLLSRQDGVPAHVVKTEHQILNQLQVVCSNLEKALAAPTTAEGHQPSASRQLRQRLHCLLQRHSMNEDELCADRSGVNITADEHRKAPQQQRRCDAQLRACVAFATYPTVWLPTDLQTTGGSAAGGGAVPTASQQSAPRSQTPPPRRALLLSSRDDMARVVQATVRKHCDRCSSFSSSVCPCFAAFDTLPVDGEREVQDTSSSAASASSPGDLVLGAFVPPVASVLASTPSTNPTTTTAAAVVATLTVSEDVERVGALYGGCVPLVWQATSSMRVVEQLRSCVETHWGQLLPLPDVVQEEVLWPLLEATWESVQDTPLVELSDEQW